MGGKARINPGNYADKKRFAVREYTDDEHHAELVRIREKFSSRRALQGTRHCDANRHEPRKPERSHHERYGDTPWMVESALDLRGSPAIAATTTSFFDEGEQPQGHDRGLPTFVARLAAEGPDWNYPIHLGVTEAGDGEDGRIKSAIGIGSLLSDGIGDTIRISLTEDSVHEIPVARALVSVAAGKRGTSLSSENFAETRYEYDPFSYQRRPSHTIDVNGLKLGGEEVVRVVVRQTTYDKLAHKLDRLGDYQPEIIYEKTGLREVDPRNHDEIKALNCETCDLLVTVRDEPRSSCYRGFPDAGRTTRAAPFDPPERHPGADRLRFSHHLAHCGDEHWCVALRRHRRCHPRPGRHDE